jgi:hypothetical protein
LIAVGFFFVTAISAFSEVSLTGFFFSVIKIHLI